MDSRRRFSALLTIGVLLLLTPFAVTFLLPSEPELEPNTSDRFAVKDALTGKWGFIDAQGKAVTPMVFDWAGDYRQGLGLAESNGAMGYIDESFEATGDWAISPRFELRHPNDQPAFGFFDGRALARHSSGKWGYIDSAGKWAIEPTYVESTDYPGVPAGDFAEGLAWFQVVEMANRSLINDNGEIIRDQDNKPVQEEYRRRLMGFIDRDGEVVIAPRFEIVQDFGEGLAGVRFKTNDRWGFIDRAGKRIISPSYEGVGRFSEGLCAAKYNGLWGYIDAAGTWQIEPTYDEARQFLEGLAPVRQGERWGYIKPSGDWAIVPTYDDFDSYNHPGDPTPFENGLARVTLDGKRIYINPQGEQVWPRNDSR